jgi:hypothetical protein
LAVHKTIYVWNTGDLGKRWWEWDERSISLLASFCRVHRFSEAIVFIGSVQWDWMDHFSHGQLPHQERFRALFAALRAAGVVPSAAYYLNDAVNDLSGFERAADIINSVVAFNRAFPGSALAGVEGDQEPTHVGPEYQRMNAAMFARRDALLGEGGGKLVLTASIKPGWLRRQLNGRPMAEAALEHLDKAMIMAYSRSVDLSLRWGDQALSMAAKLGRQLSVAVETSPRAPTGDSFWKTLVGGNCGFCKFFNMVVDMDAHYSSGPYASAYRGFVVHDYEAYFEALYGVKATEFTDTQVKSLYHRAT